MNKKLSTALKYSTGLFIVSTILAGCIHHNFMSGYLNRFFVIVAMLSFAILIITLPFYFFNRRRKRPEQGNNRIPRKLLVHYQKAGLSDSDIVFFRKTMGEAQQQIRHLEHNINDTPKLKAIDLNVDLVKVSKSMFAAIVKEPARLSEAGDFLYRHLPTLVDLTDRYIEISHHEVKTQDTWEVLAKSIEVITNLGKQVREDYSQFVADDLSEMDQSMASATDSLSTAQKDALKMNEALEKVNASYQKDKETH